ncbi:MAG: DNA-3-methyladenine glycosylase I [Bacteroidetes bacterium]|nr:MAG: DNA-3-methyladenine glycosylase I [Bacteroidota bacterium]
MPPITSYCKAVTLGQLAPYHTTYHDQVYGFPAKNDDELFGRMLMEINQAGLSWDTVLRKQHSLREAYANFDVAAVARFQEADIERLLQNPGIIRMRRKVEAAIHNAQQIEAIQAAYGSLAHWLDTHHPLSLEEWVKLFRKTFRFMGGEITKEFLRGAGYLPGAHEPDCPVYEQVKQHNPPWLRAKGS